MTPPGSYVLSPEVAAGRVRAWEEKLARATAIIEGSLDGQAAKTAARVAEVFGV